MSLLSPRTLGTSFAAVLLALAALPARAVPTAVPYAGYLTDASGAPLTETATVKAARFAAKTGGTAVWGPYTWPSVAVKDGAFTLVLGQDPSPALAPAAFSGQSLWLELTVDGTLLAPRQAVLSVPYALSAGNAEALGGQPPSAYATA